MSVLALSHTNSDINFSKDLALHNHSQITPSFRWMDTVATETEVHTNNRTYGDLLDEIADLKRELDELHEVREDLRLARAAAILSESALRKVWDNPEDAIYDEI